MWDFSGKGMEENRLRVGRKKKEGGSVAVGERSIGETESS